MAAGTVSVLHVGGYQSVAAPLDHGLEAVVPTWEFFIGDHPHAPLVDAAGRRPPFVQMADADRLVHSGAGPRSGLRSPENLNRCRRRHHNPCMAPHGVASGWF